MLNRIVIMGRLTRNPELRHTQSGTQVASFTLAVDRDFKNPNGERDTDFIEVAAWKQKAEFASQYLSKGRLAVVEGRLQIREWQDKNGSKRRSAEVIAENIYFCDSAKKQQNQGEKYPPEKEQFSDLPPNEDGDLPF